MRDQLAKLVEEPLWGSTARERSYETADAIIAALPDMVQPLDLPERRNGYWGHKDGYQIAHTNEGIFRVRRHGKVICKNIKGFASAVQWANTHNRRRILSAFGITGDT